MFSNSLSKGVAAAALAVSVAAAGAAEAQDRVRWQIPMSFGSHLTALGDAAPWMAETVGRVSGGNIDFRIVEPNKLVPSLGIFEAASTGKIDAGYSWMGYEQGQIPASALFGATPFGLEPWEYMAWHYQWNGGEGRDLVQKVFADHNVMPIFCGIISPEAAGWFRFPIESVDQLGGLKMRAAGLGGKVLQRVGMSVTVLPGGELFQALEKGTLDGTEFSLPTVDEQLKFFQVADYYHLPGWHQPSTSQYLYVNMDSWNGLSEMQQAQIETSCMAAVSFALARAEALQGPVLSSFLEGGTTAVTIPEDVLQAFKAATEEVMAEESAADPLFKEVYDSMMAFKAAHQPWKDLGYLPRDFQ